jgi:hypothetical protein
MPTGWDCLVRCQKALNSGQLLVLYGPNTFAQWWNSSYSYSSDHLYFRLLVLMLLLLLLLLLLLFCLDTEL